MPVPPILLQFIPKFLLGAESLAPLNDYLDGILTNSAILINNAKKYVTKFGNAKNTALQDVIKKFSGDDIYDFRISENIDEFKTKAKMALQGYSLTANSKKDNAKDRLLTQIAKARQLQSQLKFKNLEPQIRSSIYKNIFTSYNIDNPFKNDESSSSIVNRLEFTYLSLGEQATRNQLRRDGYNSSTINSLIPKIIESANRNKKQYKKALKIIANKEKIYNVATENISYAKIFIQKEELRQRNARKAQQKVYSSYGLIRKGR